MIDAANPDLSIVGQGGVAVCTVFLLDWLKQSKWVPWINRNSETLNRVISLVVAFGSAVGFKVLSHTGDIHTGGVITIAYPSITTILDTLGHGATQFGGQEILHKLLGNHVMGKEAIAREDRIESAVAELSKMVASMQPPTPPPSGH